jgi:hypothetical protein
MLGRGIVDHYIPLPDIPLPPFLTVRTFPFHCKVLDVLAWKLLGF